MMQATHIEKMQARKSPEQRALTPVTLGKSPADSTWVCYPRDGETVEAFQARVATMKDRLARRPDSPDGPPPGCLTTLPRRPQPPPDAPGCPRSPRYPATPETALEDHRK